MESQGNHSVCLQRKIAEDDETKQQDLDEIAENSVENNTFLKFFISFFHWKYNKTKHKSFLNIRKIKRKSNPQPKTKPLPNLHWAVPRQHIKIKKTYFTASFWSNCSVFETGKGEWHF